MEFNGKGQNIVSNIDLKFVIRRTNVSIHDSEEHLMVANDFKFRNSVLIEFKFH